MNKKVYLFAHPERSGVVKKAPLLISWLRKSGIGVFLFPPLAKELSLLEFSHPPDKVAQKIDLIISLGGDGTLFGAARNFAPYHKPILGINLGGLGFLTEFPFPRFKKGLKKALEGEFEIEKRLMIEVEVKRGRKKVGKFFGLNDAVISKGPLSRIINLRTYIGGEFITTYAADGLIISTPTGSTAYSLSAGGPVVSPEIRVLILSPICAHTLSVRPLIVSEEDKIKVILEPTTTEVMLTVDGQVGFSLASGDEITIKKAPWEAHLARLEKRNFFKILRTKLGWSGVLGS